MNAPMAVARNVLRAGHWKDEPVDVVTLDYEQRHRRRITMTGENGTMFLLDLAETTVLRDGDGLELAERDIVVVRAANEPLAEITADSDVALIRIAWHLGNRHLPTSVGPDRLLIRRDHVIEAMVEGQGGAVRHIEAPFDPEGGAYGGQHHHHHDE